MDWINRPTVLGWLGTWKRELGFHHSRVLEQFGYYLLMEPYFQSPWSILNYYNFKGIPAWIKTAWNASTFHKPLPHSRSNYWYILRNFTNLCDMAHFTDSVMNVCSSFLTQWSHFSGLGRTDNVLNVHLFNEHSIRKINRHSPFTNEIPYSSHILPYQLHCNIPYHVVCPTNKNK